MVRNTGIVFLSGGSALNSLASTMSRDGMHATHVISAFDNGGSSKHLRNEFNCIAIGDVRNRLCAIGGNGPQNNQNLLGLFRARLSESKPQPILRDMVVALARGDSDHLIGIPSETGQEISLAIQALLDKISPSFDWRKGSFGNFLLVGRYLLEGDWSLVLKWAHKVIGACGAVLPVSITSAHLGAKLENCREVLGQHTLTDQQYPIESPIKTLQLYRTDRCLAFKAEAEPFPDALDAIRKASLIVYSWGSFYTSVLPAFLVNHIPDALIERDIPRVLLINPFRDAESLGMKPADLVRVLEKYGKRDLTSSPQKVVSHVVALRPPCVLKDGFYDQESLNEIETRGIQVHAVDCNGLPQAKQIDQVIHLLLELSSERSIEQKGGLP